jgi:hypothetical protein
VLIDKKCSKCKEEKSLNLFNKDKNRHDGIYPICKICRKIYNNKTKEHRKNRDKIYYETNKLKILNNKKEYHFKNKEILNKKSRIYSKNNRDKINACARKNYIKYKENKKIYAKKNRKKINENRKKLYKNNPLFRISALLRTRLLECLDKKNLQKYTSFEKILGCSIIELKEYLTKQFKDNMNWDNHGEWEIDHIIPLSSAKTEEDVYKLNHFTNLQPLWKHENRSKGGKYPCN